MPQEKRKILSPSAGKAQNGARYGTAERSQVSKNGDPRSRGNAPDHAAAQDRSSSQRVRASGASGENGRSGVHAPHNSRVTQSTGTSRGSQKSNGPRGTRTDQPYGATFRFQKITPEMAAKHRVEQHKIRSGADGRAGVGSRDIRGGDRAVQAATAPLEAPVLTVRAAAR